MTLGLFNWRNVITLFTAELTMNVVQPALSEIVGGENLIYYDCNFSLVPRDPITIETALV